MKQASGRSSPRTRKSPPTSTDKSAWLQSHEIGYEKKLKRRHVQMIAIGGAIGTGLFLGAGGRLQSAGPALAVAYLVCGVFAFFIMRALGELVMHRPTSGSFVSYAREFLGEPASFVAGWMYYLSWATSGIADITAVAIYIKYWGTFSDIPQWVFALGALGIVSFMNLVGVKFFGEMEFWFSLVKVGALVVFLAIGTLVLGSGHEISGHAPGLNVMLHDGGFFPHGLLPAVLIMQGVVFAYAGIELLGVAAGETEDARKILPKAINGVMWRIGLFYVGSVLLFISLLPWSAYSGSESPFVTFYRQLGVPHADTVMNLVVLTAALSSLNSGLYSTGRVLRSLAMGGSAPRFVGLMNAQGVPYGGIVITVLVIAIGVPLNYIVPARAFDIVLNVASLGIISTWSFIILCQISFRRAVNRGEVPAVSFRMPGAPVTSWLTLSFLLGVLVLMALDYPSGTMTIGTIPLLVIGLAGGWRLSRRRSNLRGPESANQAGMTTKA